VAKKKQPKQIVNMDRVAERVQSVIAASHIVHREKIDSLSVILSEYFAMPTPNPQVLEEALAGWKKVHESAGRAMKPRMIARVFAAATAA